MAVAAPADNKIVVLGAGGHAKVAIEALRSSGWEIIGCTDVDTHQRTVAGAPLLGDDSVLEKIRREGVRFAFPALGNNGLRERKGKELLSVGFELPNAVAAFVAVSPSAELGRGIALFSGAAINADARIGDFAIINTNASVDHDCVIEGAAHIGPGCALAGCVKIGARSFLGVGTSVIPGISVGADCMIGAGSAVVRDIPDRKTAMGVPARVEH